VLAGDTLWWTLHRKRKVGENEKKKEEEEKEEKRGTRLPVRPGGLCRRQLDGTLSVSN